MGGLFLLRAGARDRPRGPEQIAEKVVVATEGLLQGLKPESICSTYGTTEVVP